jgi:hypothetical protein
MEVTMKRRSFLFILLLSSFIFFLPSAVWAQDSALTLAVHRIFGYGGGSQIQGSFQMEVSGVTNLTSVTFKIDDRTVGTVTQAPWRINFQTDAYGMGWHELTAVAQTTDGRTLTSNVRKFEFVSAEEGWKAAGAIMVPMFSILGLVLIVGLVSAFWPNITGKKVNVPLGATRHYGLMGGAICPKCHRPFSRHWWGLNAGLGKYDRCDHCGKWSIVRAESAERLREAEAAELQMSQPNAPVAEVSPEEKLKRQLDESRFTE